MKSLYLKGVLECEDMINKGFTFEQLRKYIEKENKVGGFKWKIWCDGFRDTIEYFEVGV